MPGSREEDFKEIMHFHINFTLFTPKLPPLWVGGHEIYNFLSPSPTDATYQGHRVKKLWYPWKGIVTRNNKALAHTVQKLFTRLKVFKKWVQGQDQRVKIMVPTDRSYHRQYQC